MIFDFNSDVFSNIGLMMGGALTWMFATNNKMKEGITDVLLKKLNKTKINNIPLERHRIFGALRQKRSTFTYFVIDEPIKIEFYKRYVEITFLALEVMAKKVVTLSEEKGDITNLIFLEIENVNNIIDTELQKQLIIPDVIYKSFEQWRDMLKSSLRDSLVEILNDDLVNSNYFLAYRTLDALISNVKVILHSGALEFSRINGAFKNLTINDIIRNENIPISK